MTISFRQPYGVDHLTAPDRRPETSLGQRFAARVRVENQIQIAWDKANWYTDNGPPVAGYNGLEHIPPDLTEYWEAFADDHSPQQSELTAEWVRRQNRNRRAAAEGGLMEQIGSGVLIGFSDVTTLPFMAVPAIKAGSVAKGIIAATTGASIEAGVSEAVLHKLDPTRTREETLYALGGAALFGSALGGLAGGMSKRAFAKATKAQEEFDALVKMSEEEGSVKRALDELDSVGARRVEGMPKDTPIEDMDLGVGSSWIALPWINPVTRMLKSSSVKVRNLANNLLEHDLYLSGNRKGRRNAIATETRIKRTKIVGKYRTTNITKKAYDKYLEAGGTLKIREFAEEVGKSMARGDKHAIEQVSQAAKHIRSEVLDPIKAAYTKLGIFDEAMETRFADSYFPRSYDWQAIKADAPRFRKMLEDDFIEQGLDADEAKEISKSIMDKIRNSPVGLLPKDLVGSAGSLKQRGISIRDEKLQEMGFLTTNVVDVMNRYLDSVVPEMHLRIDTGGIERAEELATLKENYEGRIKEIRAEAAEELKNPTKLRDASKKEVKAIYKDFVEMERIIYREEKQALKNLRDGQMEDARVAYENATRKPEGVRDKAVRTAKHKYEQDSTTNRAVLEEDELVIRTESKQREEGIHEEWDARKANLPPKERPALQKKKEAEVRKLRAKREKDLDAARKRAAKRESDLVKARDAKIGDAEKTFKNITAEAGRVHKTSRNAIDKERERGRKKARFERDKNIEMHQSTRAKLLAQEQKTKTKSEKNIRAHRNNTLKQMKRDIKRQRGYLTEGGGTHAMTKELEAIDKEFDELVEAAKTPRQRKRLESEKTRMRKDVEAMRDRLLGTYGRPNSDMAMFTNVNRQIRGAAFMAYMGMMAIAQMPEIGRPLMKHGAGAWARGLPHGVRRFFGPLDSNKVAHEFMEVGAAAEGILSTRALTSFEAEELTGKMAGWTTGFARITLMNRITDALKLVAGTAAQHRVLRDIDDWANLSAKKKEQLRRFGVDEELAVRIASEKPEGGWGKIGASNHANTAEWVDREAAELFELALLRDIDSAITTPGAGDKPLYMSHEMGKLLGQFKTFFFASHTRVYVPMLQQMARGDANAAIGVIVMMSVAYMVWNIRMFAQGRYDEIGDYTAKEMVMESMDRSGLVMLPMEGFNTVDRAFEGSVRSLMGMQPGSRYYNRSALGALIGPGPGMLEGAVRTAGTGINVLSGKDDLTEGDVRKARRLLPGQNLFYTRWLFDQMEEAVVEKTGAKRTRN